MKNSVKELFRLILTMQTLFVFGQPDGGLVGFTDLEEESVVCVASCSVDKLEMSCDVVVVVNEGISVLVAA